MTVGNEMSKQFRCLVIIHTKQQQLLFYKKRIQIFTWLRFFRLCWKTSSTYGLIDYFPFWQNCRYISVLISFCLRFEMHEIHHNSTGAKQQIKVSFSVWMCAPFPFLLLRYHIKWLFFFFKNREIQPCWCVSAV